MHPFIIS